MQSSSWTNLFIVSGFLVSAVTLVKHLPWFFSTWGLIFTFIACFITVCWRGRLLLRQVKPETKGSIRRVRAFDITQVEKKLNEIVVGQQASMHALFKVLRRNASLVNSQRHLGSYLLVGPTGTGKTLFASALGECLYGRESFINIAMNQLVQYAEPLTVILLKELKKDPYRVVLLDELDKAPPEILGSLYHLMETGELMDPVTCEWFHCPGLVIIATTNAGSEMFVSDESQKNSYSLLEHVCSHSSIPKALLARFDSIHWFGPLNDKETVQIALMQISQYYLQYGINVSYVSPDILINVLRENTRFKNFGVRQLIQVVRHSSDPIIAEARAHGWKDIRITADQLGHIVPVQQSRKVAG